MPRTAQTKDQRVNLRIDSSAKNLLQRAASYRNKSITQFLVDTAVEEAARVVREQETISLSQQDWDTFFDALNEPPEPNRALREAFDRYRKEVG